MPPTERQVDALSQRGQAIRADVDHGNVQRLLQSLTIAEGEERLRNRFRIVK